MSSDEVCLITRQEALIKCQVAHISDERTRGSDGYPFDQFYTSMDMLLTSFCLGIRDNPRDRGPWTLLYLQWT